MKKIVFECPSAPAQRANDGVIRINTALYHEIALLAHKTRQPITKIANVLIEEALKAVELVEAPLYDLTIRED